MYAMDVAMFYTVRKSFDMHTSVIVGGHRYRLLKVRHVTAYINMRLGRLFSIPRLFFIIIL